MTTEQANQQAQEAWILLAEGEWESAGKIATTLEKAGFEVGYRIRSAISEEKEEWEEAERIIAEGLEAFPEAWPLHLQLGTLYTQSGRLKEAKAVFEKALELPEVEPHWVEMNQAVVLAQMGEVDEALNLLQGIQHEELRNQAFEVKLQLLDQFQRHDLILELLDEELDELIPPSNEEEAALMSRILALIAAACYYEDHPEKETRFYLKQAIEYDRTNELSLMILREMRGTFSENGKMYGLLIQANIKSEDGLTPIMTTYGVLADSVEEAMEIVKEFEIESLDRDSIVLMETEEMEPEEEEEELKGVYLVGGLGFLN